MPTLDPKNKSLNYKRLKRESDRHEAELSWFKDSAGLEVRIKAPRGFIWISCQESVLTHFEERSDPNFINQAVDSIIAAMAEGLARCQAATSFDEECSKDSTCECSHCENFDPELVELTF